MTNCLLAFMLLYSCASACDLQYHHMPRIRRACTFVLGLADKPKKKLGKKQRDRLKAEAGAAAGADLQDHMPAIEPQPVHQTAAKADLHNSSLIARTPSALHGQTADVAAAINASQMSALAKQQSDLQPGVSSNASSRPPTGKHRAQSVAASKTAMKSGSPRKLKHQVRGLTSAAASEASASALQYRKQPAANAAAEKADIGQSKNSRGGRAPLAPGRPRFAATEEGQSCCTVCSAWAKSMQNTRGCHVPLPDVL